MKYEILIKAQNPYITRFTREFKLFGGKVFCSIAHLTVCLA
uniref:Uncharacterized protein n=1 Tax=Rheinheimera sp. BAL341 TaxID=1708203 RepID=A0A486XK79_9GAMM